MASHSPCTLLALFSRLYSVIYTACPQTLLHEGALHTYHANPHGTVVTTLIMILDQPLATSELLLCSIHEKLCWCDTSQYNTQTAILSLFPFIISDYVRLVWHTIIMALYTRKIPVTVMGSVHSAECVPSLFLAFT